MQKLISNRNQKHLLDSDLKSKSQFKNLISNSDFKSCDFKSYPTLRSRLVPPSGLSIVGGPEAPSAARYSVGWKDTDLPSLAPVPPTVGHRQWR